MRTAKTLVRFDAAHLHYFSSCPAAHIFFDDAMELNDDEEWVPNQFVKLMMSIIDEAARYHVFILLQL